MLRIEGLSHYYSQGETAALTDISLQLAPGEIYGLLGPNGAGKTTLINALAGLLQPQQGNLHYGDRDLSTWGPNLLGIAPQDNLLYSHLTVWENLRFFAQLYGVPKSQQRNRLGIVLAQVGLSDRAKTLVQHLSGGLQRRLNLAIALVHQPRVLIVDEPSTGLDIAARENLWEILGQLKHEGLGILLTTHILAEAETVCDRVGILHHGQLLAQGTLAQLRQRLPTNPAVLLQTSDMAGAIARLDDLGYPYRQESDHLLVWFPEARSLAEILDVFENIPLDGILRQPIRLQHVYRELMAASAS